MNELISNDINNMQPGRELDALVAEKVLGHIVINEIQGHWWINDTFHTLPSYSTNISAAWEVVDKLKIAVIPQSVSAPNDMKYLARIEEDFGQEEIQVFASTASEAICKAALLAVNGGEQT